MVKLSRKLALPTIIRLCAVVPLAIVNFGPGSCIARSVKCGENLETALAIYCNASRMSMLLCIEKNHRCIEMFRKVGFRVAAELMRGRPNPGRDALEERDSGDKCGRARDPAAYQSN